MCSTKTVQKKLTRCNSSSGAGVLLRISDFCDKGAGWGLKLPRIGKRYRQGIRQDEGQFATFQEIIYICKSGS